MIAILAFVTFLCAPPQAPLASPAWEPALRQTIALPDVEGRIDHMAFDPKTRRLFIAALGNGTLEVVDTVKGERIRSIRGLKEPQGAVLVPRAGQVVIASGGDGTLRAYDVETLAEVRRIDVGDDADNVRLTDDGGQLVVGTGKGALVLVDARAFQKIGEIPLPAHPESFQLEPGTTRVFVNVPDHKNGGGSVLVVDRAARQITATWTIKDAESNFPMALDAARKRLYVGCRKPARLGVIDTATGATLGSPECVGDLDDVFVDTATSSVLLIGGGGALDVFGAGDAPRWERMASVATSDGARTGLLVEAARTVFVACPKRGTNGAAIRQYSLPAADSRR